ncbi:phage tail tape measure protein, partial [Prosthecodimorpha staleyi]
YIAPVGAAYGGKRMLDQSIGFEKAFAEFRKASGITDEGELKGFENQMVRMAIKYGVPRNDVAGMFSEASKSGIANADLGEFVRIAIAQAVGWDIDPRGAAKSMAETKAGMNKTIPELATLGDKINFLGDNSAAREGDISYAFGQAGPNVKMSGLSEDTTLAMLTAALSTGLHPGKTATWLSAFVGVLRNAPDQPKRVAGALKDLGYTPQEMADGMKNNADKTLDDFWERVSKADNKTSIFTRLFGVEWQDETARVAEAGPEYRKQRDALKVPKNYEGSLFKGLEIQQSTTDNHLKRFKAQVSEISDRLTRWMLPGINQAIDQTLDGVDRADKAAASGGTGWQMLGAAAPGLERDLARDLLRKKSARADGALLDLMRLQERRNQVGDQKMKAEAALPSVIGRSARKGAEARVRDLGTEIGTIDADIAQAIAKLREARGEVERFQRENADALSGSFGAAGAQSMDGYVKAIEEGGARAVAAAQRIVGQLRSIFGFTASPTIAPNFGGAAPAGGGTGGETGGGIGKQTSTGGGNVQVTQHIHGTDPAATARHAQREQARAVRTAMAGALHDLGSWA